MELYIRHQEDKGRAVYCDTDLQAGDEIEICPVIVCPPEDRQYIDKTHLYNYYFLWGEDQDSLAIALGFGSVYNHSYTPNAVYETYFEEEYIRFIALLDIPADTEITINYNHDAGNRDQLWFEVK